MAIDVSVPAQDPSSEICDSCSATAVGADDFIIEVFIDNQPALWFLARADCYIVRQVCLFRFPPEGACS